MSLKVLITSPSLIVDNNIGGISSMTKLLIENNQEVSYSHFVRGKRINDNNRLMWIIKQPIVLLTFIRILIEQKDLKIAHINMPLERISILRDSALVIISALFKKKVIVHLHGGAYSLNKNIPFILKFLINISIRSCVRVIVLGEKEKNFLIDMFKIKHDQVVILPNSVNILPDIRKNPVDKMLLILYMGRIDKKKGLLEMILALELLNKRIAFKFLIAGNGPDKEYFLKECEKRISGKYEYLGLVFGDQKAKILQDAHVLLLVSYYEGLPYILLEAMANKVVSIVTPVGAIPEIINNDINGILVPLHDYNAINNCIIALMKDPNHMQEIGQNAYNTIKSQYSLEEYINNLNSTYKSVL